MTTECLEIQWYGPYKFYGNKDESVLLVPIGKRKGVYLWSIQYENKYLPYYVGETGVSFAIRSMQHIQSYLNGFYRVFDPREFVKGNKVLLWGGMWKSGRKGPDTLNEFLKNYLTLSPKILEFLGQLNLFLAPVDTDRRIRERIEAAISKKLIKQSGVVGKFQDHDIRYMPRRSEEESMRLGMRFSEPIIGLEEDLLI